MIRHQKTDLFHIFQRLLLERDSLQEINEELQMTSHQQGLKVMTQDSILLGAGDGQVGLSPLEMKLVVC